MTSEEQYYSAKVFLKAFNCAHETLRNCAENERLVDRSTRQIDILANAVQKQEVVGVAMQVVVKDGRLAPGKNFDKSRQYKLKLFSNQLFKKWQLDGASTFTQLKESLNKGILQLSQQLTQ